MKHCNGIMHTVKAGDTLYSISMEHKVPLALVLRANPYVDVYNLQVGETICVPVRGDGRPEMMPYTAGCSRCIVTTAVPGEAQPEESGVQEMMQTDENENKENTEDRNMEGSEQKDQDQMMEETVIEKELQATDDMVYITKEGDTLEEILGVDKIALLPGIALYRQK